jgi:transposase
MKKISTAAAQEMGKFEGQRLTIGLDLGDRSSYYCVLDEAGGVLLEQRISTTPKAVKVVFGGRRRNAHLARILSGRAPLTP